MAVQAQGPGPLRAQGIGIEMRHLANGMNTTVGSSAAIHADFMVGHTGQGPFQTALNGRFLGLDLPAQKGASVVLNSYCKPKQIQIPDSEPIGSLSF